MMAGDAHQHATSRAATRASTDARNVPKPVQRPRVPIMVGGNGPNVTWRLAAKHADELNLDGMDPSEVAAALPTIRARCEEIGRDPASLAISVHMWWDHIKTDGQQRVDRLAGFRELGRQPRDGPGQDGDHRRRGDRALRRGREGGRGRGRLTRRERARQYVPPAPAVDPIPPAASYHPAMSAAFPISRRLFLVDLGRAGLAVAVLGVAGVRGPGRVRVPRGSSAASALASPSGSGAAASAAPSAASGEPPSGSGSGAAGGATAWHRVNLGFVSAYILVRGGEAAVVDTGVAGSDGAIGDALAAAGLGWADVGHVILTHQHQDHAGSAAAVLEAAPDATGYAGAEDIPAIAVPRALVPVADGDDVFGLRIVATPGHTKGHVAVLDPAGGILVAGDALGTTDGKPTPPNPGFSEDMDEAMASIAKLGSLAFETLLVGHGDPIEAGAAGLVKALAAG